MDGMRIAGLAVGIFLWGIASADAQTFDFKVCNRSSIKASVAVSSRDTPQSKDWFIAGWWNVGPGQCTAVGRYPKGTILAHAQGDGGKRWNGPKKFCVESTRFKYQHYASRTCDSALLRGFYEFKVASDTYTWNLGN